MSMSEPDPRQVIECALRARLSLIPPALLPDTALDEALVVADKALYRAKQQGRNPVCLAFCGMATES